MINSEWWSGETVGPNTLPLCHLFLELLTFLCLRFLICKIWIRRGWKSVWHIIGTHKALVMIIVTGAFVSTLNVWVSEGLAQFIWFNLPLHFKIQLFLLQEVEKGSINKYHPSFFIQKLNWFFFPKQLPTAFSSEIRYIYPSVHHI